MLYSKKAKSYINMDEFFFYDILSTSSLFPFFVAKTILNTLKRTTQWDLRLICFFFLCVFFFAVWNYRWIFQWWTNVFLLKHWMLFLFLFLTIMSVFKLAKYPQNVIQIFLFKKQEQLVYSKKDERERFNRNVKQKQKDPKYILYLLYTFILFPLFM